MEEIKTKLNNWEINEQRETKLNNWEINEQRETRRNGVFIKINKNNVIADFKKNINIKINNNTSFWISKISVLANSIYMNELTIIINPEWDYYISKTKRLKGSTIIKMLGDYNGR